MAGCHELFGKWVLFLGAVNVSERGAVNVSRRVPTIFEQVGSLQFP